MSETTGTLPLAGLKVVEISFMESVCYAGVLLAQLGAEVIKIEPPGGDPVRHRAPFARGPDGADVSLAFEFLNAGKGSMVHDPTDAEAAWRTCALVEAANVVIIDHQTVAQIGCALPERAPGQLRVFVGLYGGSPEKVVSTSALTRLHASTSGYIIPADLDVTKRPAWSGPYIFECMHGVGLSVAVAAELAREEGGDVDYSLQAYGLWLDKLLFSRTSTSGVEIHRYTAPYPYGGNMACQDGYVSILVLEEHQWRGFCHMIDRPEWLDDERFTNGVLRNRNRAPLAEGLARWCAARTVVEVLTVARKCDVPAGRCRSPQDVLDAKVATARAFFVERKTAFGTMRVPSLPFGPNLRGDVTVPSPPLGSK
jgi:crotonobetainyl-CoA:carnitine CoA-transferase CaiB-like acyl-CoA transferase